MNFLAHFYLAGDCEPLLAGSFIADFLRGQPELSHAPLVYKGIVHHRRIDAFADRHPLVAGSKKRLWRRHRHYSAVIVDIFYDHFLAVNWHDYSAVTLEEFARSTYAALTRFRCHFPARAQKTLSHMQAGNWLVNYRRLEGVDQALLGLARRSSFQSQMAAAGEDLRLEYSRFERDFRTFFPLLSKYSHELIEGGELEP